MGAWGFNVMESDSDMDYQAVLITDVGGLDLFDYLDADGNIYREDIEAKLPEMVSYCLSQEGDDQRNSLQVLADIILFTGSAITKQTQALIRYAAAHDSWAVENPERKQAMNELIEAISEYDCNGGTCVNLSYKGLFETILGDKE